MERGMRTMNWVKDFFVQKRITSAVKKVEFVRDRMSCIILRGRWFHIIVLNVHSPIEEKIDDVKVSIYEVLESVSAKFLKYNTKIFLADFNVKVGKENLFKLTVRNERLHKIRNDNGVRVVYFATSKNLNVKNTKFSHHSIHKYT
jgi:hypothetical protein